MPIRTDLHIERQLYTLDLARFDEKVARIEIHDDELIVRGELIVLPDENLLHRVITETGVYERDGESEE